MSRSVDRRRVLRLWIAALAAVALPLAACGKKGGLKPPPGKKSDYPRKYPSR